jgi:cytochrome c551/c552
MADNTGSEQLEKRAPDVPEPDPIADRSLSMPLLVSSLVLVLTLVWALYDEVFGQRPWRNYQGEFKDRYSAFLERSKRNQRRAEGEVKQSEQYQLLNANWEDAKQEADEQRRPVETEMKRIDQQIADITPPFQDARSWISSKNYQLETTDSAGGKESIRKSIEEKKREKIDFSIHNDRGEVEERELDFYGLEKLYNDLRARKAELTASIIKISQPVNEAARKRDQFLQQELVGLTEQQVSGLSERIDNFKFEIKQLNVANGAVVDRCESCHLGTREPVTIRPANMRNEERKVDELSRAFASHPNMDLLKVHDPDKFGCSTCHGGNGRGTTSVEKAHGRYKHWLWPLHYKENTQAGCVQCHNQDRVLPMATTLNRGRDLFQSRGCVGCHRYEGYDREADAVSNAEQTQKMLDLEIFARDREIKALEADKANPQTTDEQAIELEHRIKSVNQIKSQMEGRIDEYDRKLKYLRRDQKKVGPNLKEIKAKLKKEWVPVWLADPQAFRPGTKMPTFRLTDHEVQALSAFLWQSAIDLPVPTQTPGTPQDAEEGKQLFRSIGCMGCHSIDGGKIGIESGTLGGDFAGNLSRLGEKANFDYVVRWIYNPRLRLAPYSPSDKKDLLPADYASKNMPFRFDDEHSKSPITGREMLIHNQTVMPNFRLTIDQARKIATFLTSLRKDGFTPQPYDVSFMDDPNLAREGETLMRKYGCASCHEAKGMESEQRIGTELTLEGSKPIERLDFALMQTDAQAGRDPFTGEELKRGKWYDHKGFIEYKLRSPGIYDLGKEKGPDERLKMPNIYMPEEDMNAIATFLLGSVETSIPQSLRYNAVGQRKEVQEGWWVVQKYNCMGCHNVLVGQDTALMRLPMYQSSGAAATNDPNAGENKLPPRLTTEGARVNPEWLLKFLKDPSLSAGGGRAGPAAREQAIRESLAAHSSGATSGDASARAAPQQPATAPAGLPPQWGESRNGLRPYLEVRMPTFNFSPNELQAIVNFFMAASQQQQPYIPERLDPLAEAGPLNERQLARKLFTAGASPCLKCHMTGDAAHDAQATAPNFFIAAERLKPAWTKRWIYDPQIYSPGVGMPSGQFVREPDGRISFKAFKDNPNEFPELKDYQGDHLDLIVRYMFQLTPEDQSFLRSSASRPAPSGAPPAGSSTPAGTTAASPGQRTASGRSSGSGRAP